MDATQKNIETLFNVSGLPCFSIFKNGTCVGTGVHDNIQDGIDKFNNYYCLLQDGVYSIKFRPNAKSSYSQEHEFVKGSPGVTNMPVQQPMHNMHGIGAAYGYTNHSDVLYYRNLVDDYRNKLDKLKEDLSEEKAKRKEAERDAKASGLEGLMTPDGISAIGNVLANLRNPAAARAAMVGTMQGDATAAEMPQSGTAAQQLKMQRILNACMLIENAMEVDMCEVLEKLAVMSEEDPAKLTIALSFLK